MSSEFQKAGEFRSLFARLVTERRRLRSVNTLYLGRGKMLIGLDMGYNVICESDRTDELTPALQPSVHDLSVLALALVVLGGLSDPISVLVGSSHPVTPLNLALYHPKGRVHVVNPDHKRHRALKKALREHEGECAALFHHIQFVGPSRSRQTMQLAATPANIMNCIDGWPGSRKTLQTITSQQAPLEVILGEDVLTQAHFIICDAPKFLSAILEGIKRLWLLNPYAHVVVRIDPSAFTSEDWDHLKRRLSDVSRRMWWLPRIELAISPPTRPRSLWITPSGV